MSLQYFVCSVSPVDSASRGLMSEPRQSTSNGAVLNGGSLSRVAGENVGVYGINQGDLALNSGNYSIEQPKIEQAAEQRAAELAGGAFLQEILVWKDR